MWSVVPCPIPGPSITVLSMLTVPSFHLHTSKPLLLWHLKIDPISFFWGHHDLWQNSSETRNLVAFKHLWPAWEKSSGLFPQSHSCQALTLIFVRHGSDISSQSFQWQGNDGKLSSVAASWRRGIVACVLHHVAGWNFGTALFNYTLLIKFYRQIWPIYLLGMGDSSNLFSVTYYKCLLGGMSFKLLWNVISINFISQIKLS